MSPRRVQRWFVLSLLALVLLGLILIAHDEIRAAPYDEAAYIGQAGAWYWKNTYKAWTYSRQPGYPLFLAIGSLLGVPTRLVIEALWMSVSLLVVRVAKAAGARRPLQVLLFALLLFHPFTTDLFCHALSENLYTAALLTSLAALAMANTRRSRRSIRRWGLAAGVACAIVGITRQETVLIYVLILFAGVIVLKMWATRVIPRRLAIRRLLLACLLPLGIALGAEHAVRAANYARIGAYVTYDWSLPGFKALYRAMLSVPPEDPKLRVPIPKDVRERVAAASPTYARVLDAMTADPRCAPFWRDGARTSGVPGEPGSYNLWLMRQAAWYLHDYSFASARETDAFYRSIVGEIRGAQNRRELPRRWAPFSFIPPDWGQLAREVRGSLPACWRAMIRIGFTRGEPYEVSELDRERFDAVGLRRSALVRDRAAYGVHMHRPQVVARFDAVKRTLAGALPVFTILALVAAVLGAVAAQFTRKKLPPVWYVLTTLLWAAFVLRLFLVALLDATGVVAVPRYMFPNAVILVPLAVLAVHSCSEFARARLKPKG